MTTGVNQRWILRLIMNPGNKNTIHMPIFQVTWTIIIHFYRLSPLFNRQKDGVASIGKPIFR